MHNFRDLRTYQKSVELTSDIYRLLSKLTEYEKFGLLPQMRRAAISIPSNIAEGAGRNSQKEFKHFLSISLGSCYELETQFMVARNLGLLDDQSVKVMVEHLIDLQKMIFALQKSIKA